MDDTWSYSMEGTAGDGQTWRVVGTVSGEFLDCSELVLRDSFVQLTQGKAVYGKPGVGCRGPYSITRCELTLVL